MKNIYVLINRFRQHERSRLVSKFDKIDRAEIIDRILTIGTVNETNEFSC